MGLSGVPVFEIMIVVSILTLIGNLISLMIINQAKSDEVYM